MTSASRERRPAGAWRLAPLALAIAGGCAGPIDAGRTGGLSLELERRTEPHGRAVWTLDTAGQLTWAGGPDALAGRPGWAARLDDAPLAELVELVARIEAAADAGGEDRAVRAEAASDAGPGAGTRIELTIRRSGARRRTIIDPPPPAGPALVARLEDAASVRHAERLSRLPRASGVREPGPEMARDGDPRGLEGSEPPSAAKPD